MRGNKFFPLAILLVVLSTRARAQELPLFCDAIAAGSLTPELLAKELAKIYQHANIDADELRQMLAAGNPFSLTAEQKEGRKIERAQAQVLLKKMGEIARTKNLHERVTELLAAELPQSVREKKEAEERKNEGEKQVAIPSSPLMVLIRSTREPLETLVQSPDGRWMFSAPANLGLRLWSLEVGGKHYGIPSNHPATVLVDRVLGFTADSQSVVYSQAPQSAAGIAGGLYRVKVAELISGNINPERIGDWSEASALVGPDDALIFTKQNNYGSKELWFRKSLTGPDEQDPNHSSFGPGVEIDFLSSHKSHMVALMQWTDATSKTIRAINLNGNSPERSNYGPMELARISENNGTELITYVRKGRGREQHSLMISRLSSLNSTGQAFAAIHFDLADIIASPDLKWAVSAESGTGHVRASNMNGDKSYELPLPNDGIPYEVTKLEMSSDNRFLFIAQTSTSANRFRLIRMETESIVNGMNGEQP